MAEKQWINYWDYTILEINIALVLEHRPFATKRTFHLNQAPIIKGFFFQLASGREGFSPFSRG